jgi:cell division septation protein DedD
VQVGSYAREATAERLAKQLRDQGQSAFVMPVKSGSTTLYRVRIGPLQDRASAEAVLRDVKSPGAAIVAHP